VLEYDRFHAAVRSPDGLEREGVQLSPMTLEHLRGHDAYARAWYDNWSRDGQPARASESHRGPYAPSPEPLLSSVAASGYAVTGGPETPATPSIGLGTTYATTSTDSPGAFATATAPSADHRTPVWSASRYRVPPRLGEPNGPAELGLDVPAAPDPGWYPSPSTPGHEQWWNGSAWTPEHRPAARRRKGFGRFGRR
jgi:hypothetical protein